MKTKSYQVELEKVEGEDEEFTDLYELRGTLYLNEEFADFVTEF